MDKNGNFVTYNQTVIGDHSIFTQNEFNLDREYSKSNQIRKRLKSNIYNTSDSNKNYSPFMNKDENSFVA